MSEKPQVVTIPVRGISLLTHLNVTRHFNGLCQAELIALSAVHGQNFIVVARGRLLYTQTMTAWEQFAYVTLYDVRILGRLTQQLE